MHCKLSLYYYCHAECAWGALQELLDPVAAMTSQGKARRGRKWYFEKLNLRDVRCNLSLCHHRHAEAAWGVLQELLDPVAAMTSQGKARRGRKWYFEKLDLRDVRCNLSLVPRAGFHEVEVGSNRYRLATALGIHFINITDVPLRLSALQLKNAFVSPQSLLTQLLRHLFYQVGAWSPTKLTVHQSLRSCSRS